jgi:RHH-type proline utilization regulon transcriptional repressor/proline dehydrogenase/delta 1-pyrroline-5-carboxylate dehydrogenase
MNFEETAGPPIGAIRGESCLLRLAREWRLELAWGKHQDHNDDLKKTVLAILSYIYSFEQEFSQEKDYFHLRGQDNILRYLPVGAVVVRVHAADSLFDVLGRIAAAKISGCNLVVSVPTDLNNGVIAFLHGREGNRIVGDAPLLRMTDDELIDYMPKVQRFRYASGDRVPAAVWQAAAEAGFYISRVKVFMEGRLELLQYFQEQSICDNYHRYGNLGERGLVKDSG